MNDYPKAQWLFDLVNVIAKRDFVEKKEAVWIVLEEIERIDDLYLGGASPQEAYLELQ